MQRPGRRLRMVNGRSYVAALLLVAAVSILGTLAVRHVSPANLVMFYLLAVVITALRWGGGPAVLSAILGALGFDFFLVPPRLSFTIANAEYLITFGALLTVALVMGTLTSRLRSHAAMLHQREEETAALYAFSRTMVAARTLPGIAAAIIQHIEGTFGRPVGLQVHTEGQPEPQNLHFGADLPPGTAEDSVPLSTARGVVGLLAVQYGPENEPLNPEERQLLEAFGAQAAVALERANLAETARRAEVLLETEKLYDALLHSVSHALRTPLAAILGSLSTVLDQRQLDESTRRDLLEAAREETERLNGLVGNLLDMTRLESGRLKLNLDYYDPADVVGAALGQTADRLKHRPVTVQMADDLPLVPLDQVLIVHVLENLLDNADKYSPPGQPVEIAINRAADELVMTVADRGVGIEAAEAERIFEKFFRLERPGSPAGTGLGLSICKGIVEAHRGKIWAEPRQGGGTAVTFTLPLREKAAKGGGPE